MTARRIARCRSSGKWHQRAKAMKSEDGSSHLFWQTQVYHFTFHAAEGSHRGGAVKERAKPCLYDLRNRLEEVSLATLVHVRGESWCRRFRADSEQFQVQQRQASDCDEFMTSDAEDAVCTPSTLMFHLTVFLFGWQSVCASSFVAVVLHWCRRGYDGGVCAPLGRRCDAR